MSKKLIFFTSLTLLASAVVLLLGILKRASCDIAEISDEV